MSSMILEYTPTTVQFFVKLVFTTDSLYCTSTHIIAVNRVSFVHLVFRCNYQCSQCFFKILIALIGFIHIFDIS